MNDQRVLELLKEITEKAPDTGQTSYAQAYARAGLKNPRTGTPMEGKGLRTQVLYVLSNLGHWRGSDARRIKAELKREIG